jgi:hypothetical protein
MNTTAKVVAVLAIATLAATGCKRMTKVEKHWNTSWDGLDRTITLYAEDGRVLGSWHSKTYVETDPPVVAFIDSAGKEVKLMGTVVIQER